MYTHHTILSRVCTQDWKGGSFHSCPSAVHQNSTCPHRLGSMVNSQLARQPAGCNANHRKPFLPHTSNVTYSLPLLCREDYSSQTYQCLNAYLCQHKDRTEALSGDIPMTSKAYLSACPGCRPANQEAVGSDSSHLGWRL